MFPAPTELKWTVSAYSRAQPADLSFSPPELSELTQVLISKKNVSRLIEMSCFSLLQSSASQSQFWSHTHTHLRLPPSHASWSRTTALLDTQKEKLPSLDFIPQKKLHTTLCIEMIVLLHSEKGKLLPTQFIPKMQSSNTHTHTHSHTFECRIGDPKGKAPVIGVHAEKQTTHYHVNWKYRPSSFREL